jgi:large subunit ribosomal protein L13e
MAKVISVKGYREGRGFSLGELKSAGVSKLQAKRMRIRIDVRRRSTHDFNVKELAEMVSRYAPSKMRTVERKRKKKEAPPKSVDKKSKPKRTASGIGAKKSSTDK